MKWENENEKETSGRKDKWGGSEEEERVERQHTTIKLHILYATLKNKKHFQAQ